MSKPSDYLLITEITTERHHQVPLKDIRERPVTIGRSELADIQIGHDTDAYGWISKLHCTLFAQLRGDASGSWDYYLQDGHNVDGYWLPSQHGIWVGGRQHPADLPIQLRPGPGRIEVFPRMTDSKYSCILEWPAESEPSEDADKEPPTLQQYEAVVMERKIFEDQAEHNRRQLERLGRTMAQMQAQFTTERTLLDSKIDQQSTLLLKLSMTLEQERQVNQGQENQLHSQQDQLAEQEKQLADQRKRNNRVRLAILLLSLIVFAIALLALQIDQKTWRETLEWVLLAISILGAVFGAKS